MSIAPHFNSQAEKLFLLPFSHPPRTTHKELFTCQLPIDLMQIWIASQCREIFMMLLSLCGYQAFISFHIILNFAHPNTCQILVYHKVFVGKLAKHRY
jgi:hypothetical protein